MFYINKPSRWYICVLSKNINWMLFLTVLEDVTASEFELFWLMVAKIA